MAAGASSLITVGSGWRNRDQLSVPFPARPQAMTVYVRFIEHQKPNFVKSTLTEARLFHIGGDNGGDGSTPRFFVFKTNAGATYEVTHHNNVGSVFSSVTLSPVAGDLIELVAQLSATGTVQIHGSKNGGAVSSGTASAALVLASAWSAGTLWLGCLGNGGQAHAALCNLEIRRGGISFGQMRDYAGTSAR